MSLYDKYHSAHNKNYMYELIKNVIHKEYEVDILETEHEQKMCEQYGEATIIQHFPERTSPFWNMRHKGDGIFNKVDVILYGQETIGSAERATDKVEMRQMFETISDGGYKEKLYDLFGKDRCLHLVRNALKF